ncbi:hypothetical protein PFISCL1PPCAC_23835, partial [Pristionchus fissidentatus]
SEARFTSMPERSGPSVFATRKERRKGCTEMRDNGELASTNDPMDFASIPMPMGIPLPPQPPSGGGFSSSTGAGYTTGPAIPVQPQTGVKQEEQEEEVRQGDGSLVPAPFKMEEEKEFKAEEEEEEEEENVGSEVLKLAATATPFGAWSRVKKSETGSVPYVKPVSEEQKKADERARLWRQEEEAAVGFTAAAPKKVEAKIEFTEKVAPILTKKKNAGVVEFKKKSAPKSVRRRDEE